MEEMLLNVKRQIWQNWFTSEIPMLGNLSPVEASQTEQGRQKLEELFAHYTQMETMMQSNGGSSMHASVPPAWARWKLGYGPGSAESFAAEEAIFNSSAPGETRREARHQGRLQKRQQAIFVPRRCELKGCEAVVDNVQKCSACTLALYCSKEHQKEDWPRHKVDCKHLKGSGLTRKYFSGAEELQKYPLGCFPLPDPPSGGKLSCFICGAGPDEVKLGRTDCCNATVCDNAEEYQLFSYSRDFCKKSHVSYTVCGFHHREGHDGDWRQCSVCKKELGGIGGARSWFSTNGFNLTPALESDLPQGSMVTVACDGCRGRITPGHDIETHFNGKIYCGKCK